MMMVVARVGGQAAGRQAGIRAGRSEQQRAAGSAGPGRRRRRNSARAQSGQRLARQTQLEGGCAASMHRAGRGQPTKCRTTRPTATHDAAPQRRRSQLSPVQAHGAPPLRCSVALVPLPSLLWLTLTIDIGPVTLAHRPSPCPCPCPCWLSGLGPSLLPSCSCVVDTPSNAIPALLARIRDMPSLGQPSSRLSCAHYRAHYPPSIPRLSPVCLFVCPSVCPSVYPLPPSTPTPKTTLQRLVMNTNHRLLDCHHARPPLCSLAVDLTLVLLHASTHAESAPPLRDTATVPARATIALLSPRPASLLKHAMLALRPVPPCPVLSRLLTLDTPSFDHT
jgi:hypothetical protein